MAERIEPNYVMKGFCERVIDGDTVVLTISPAFRISLSRLKFRLYGVDTSEVNAKDPDVRVKAKQATDFVRDAIDGKEIMVQTLLDPRTGQTHSDSFGRYLAVIFYDDRDRGQVNLNQELLDLGLAEVFK